MLVLVLALLIGGLDQITKQVVRDLFNLHQSIQVIPGFFDLTYVRNTGAAWGMFGGQNALLITLSLLMLAAMIFFRRSFLSDTLIHRVALGCMVGGIVGNLLDRMRMGYVTDFFDFYIGPHHWPAFNIADAAICTGVGLYVISSMWADRRARREALASAANAPADTPAVPPASP